MKETQKTLNEELNVIKKMMGLNEDIAKYQFAKDIQDDSDYVQFKKDAIYKDDRDHELSYGTPRADGNDPFVTKSKKWDRVKPDDLKMGDDEMDEEMEPGFSTSLNKRDRNEFDVEEAWKDRCDILHMVSQYGAALKANVSGTIKFLDRVEGPITKDTLFSRVLNQTFYEHILSMESTVKKMTEDLKRYREMTEKLAPNE